MTVSILWSVIVDRGSSPLVMTDLASLLLERMSFFFDALIETASYSALLVWSAVLTCRIFLWSLWPVCKFALLWCVSVRGLVSELVIANA